MFKYYCFHLIEEGVRMGVLFILATRKDQGDFDEEVKKLPCDTIIISN